MLKEFLISDILKKVNTKKVSLKKGDCSDYYTKDFNLPARTATTQNQGLGCYVPRDMATVLRNKISVSANGDFCAFWHDRDFTILQDSYALEGNGFELNERRALYIITSMYKALERKYNWNNKSGWEKIKNELISLPIHNILCPDFERLQDIVGMGGDVDMTTIDTSSWKEFKLSDLFEITSTKALDEGKLSFVSEGVNFVGRVGDNNGVKGKIDKQDFEPNEPFTITATVIGNYKYVKYQEEPYYCSQNINKLIPKFEINKQIALFMITGIQKFVSKYDGQQGGYKLDDLKNFVIKLPTKEVEEIDFDYMEKYIAELEGQRIAELEGYLVATGLNDYVLTEEDKRILSLSTESRFNEDSDNENVDGNGLQIRKFKLDDLFVKKTMKGYPKTAEDMTENENGYPVYGQNIQWKYAHKLLLDEKYLHRVDPDYPILAYTSSVGEIGMIDEDFYRSGDNGAFQGLFPKHYRFNKYQLNYLLSVLKKHFDNFGYSTSMANIMELDFYLPVKVENNSIVLDEEHKYHKDGYIPDFEFMEKYIRVIEKLVIADVVKYKDEIIEKTKEILSA